MIGAFAGLSFLITRPLDPAPYLRVNASPEVLDRNGRLLHAFLNPDEQWCFPRPLEDISPKLIAATIAAEDQRFWRHPGVDPFAVLRAVKQNLLGGTVASGASTITMQVVKRHAGDARSVWGKARQATLALRLERAATKREILEAYLNGAPYGLNLAGCETASLRYFGKPASELALEEAALIAGLPKAPSALMPIAHPERARARRSYVLARLEAEAAIGPSERREADAMPLHAAWNDFPAFAPHLARELANRERTMTTLDRTIQSDTERILRGRIAKYQGDVKNGAVIVIDVASAQVLARAGSAHFFSKAGGQFDASRALRSPGSALKPFTYALAIDNQRLYPGEVLLDRALDYGRYNPENFDREFRGLIPASDALRRSLNVPAVTVLERVGYVAMADTLKMLGLTTLARPAAHYGLGLTLGNCEVRLDELAAAYTALASMGMYRPLSQLSDEHASPGARVFSQETCAAIFAMLEQPLPAEFEWDAVRANGAPARVCWKTGTSAGNRDAWAFVFNRHYVVGVWMGNNGGAPNPRLVGAEAALPLAARIFRGLPRKGDPAWPDAAADSRTVSACAISGLPATEWCPAVQQAQIPAHLFLNRRCDVHYPAPDGGIRERWPGAARGWDLAKIDASAARAQTASARPAEKALRIVRPVNYAEFVLTGEPEGDRIRLESSLDAYAAVHWYADDRYLGQGGPGSPVFFPLTVGDHRITCLAPSGAIETVAITVSQPAGPARFE